MVTKRLDWYKNKLTSVFGGAKVYEIYGYYVFIAEKNKYFLLSVPSGVPSVFPGRHPELFLKYILKISLTGKTQVIADFA